MELLLGRAVALQRDFDPSLLLEHSGALSPFLTLTLSLAAVPCYIITTDLG